MACSPPPCTSPGGVEVQGAQLQVDLSCRDAERLHARRVEFHADLTTDAAAAADLGHTCHGKQALAHRIVHEPGQVLIGECARAHRVRDDLVAIDVEPLDGRFLDPGGQIHAHLGDRIAHIGHCTVNGRTDVELDEDTRLALNRERNDVVDVAHARYGGFDLLHDLGFDLLGRGTRLVDLHQHQREGDVRVERYRQPQERDRAHEQQHDEQHDRRDGVADCPGGNVLHGIAP